MLPLRLSILLSALTLATPSFAARCGGDFNTFAAGIGGARQLRKARGLPNDQGK